MKQSSSDIICDTSPLQYLHQIGLLHLLPALVEKVIVPTAVLSEIEIGRENSVNLPNLPDFDWIEIRQAKNAAVLPPIADLGTGETEVLVLALESSNAIVILDDLLARKTAEKLKIKVIGTLGILLEAKNENLISEVKPILSKLDKLGFRLSKQTENIVLKLADEQL